MDTDKSWTICNLFLVTETFHLSIYAYRDQLINKYQLHSIIQQIQYSTIYHIILLGQVSRVTELLR